MLNNYSVSLDFTIPYLKKEYRYIEDFKPYRLSLVKELLQDSDMEEIVNFLEKSEEQHSEEFTESIDSDIDYYFDVFSVLKIVDASKDLVNSSELRSYIEETERIQTNIILEKIKLSLIPYFNIVNGKKEIDENIKQYFEYLSRKTYDYSNEVNPFLNYEFKDEKFNILVRNIDRIFKENKYEKSDKSTTNQVRNKINNELFSYINNPADSSLKNKVDYVKLILLLSTNGLRPKLIDRYRIAICGLKDGESEEIISKINTASSKRINKLFLYYNNPKPKLPAPTSQNNTRNAQLIAITNKVSQDLKIKGKYRCLGLLLSDDLNYFSLSGIETDKKVLTESQHVKHIEDILKEKYNNIQRKRLSDNQITFYEYYSAVDVKNPYFDNITRLQTPMTLLDFKNKYKITDIFAGDSNHYYRCFSCCEPKLLADLLENENELTLFIKQKPCPNCELIIPEYKNKLNDVIYYNEEQKRIESFTI